MSFNAWELNNESHFRLNEEAEKRAKKSVAGHIREFLGKGGKIKVIAPYRELASQKNVRYYDA